MTVCIQEGPMQPDPDTGQLGGRPGDSGQWKPLPARGCMHRSVEQVRGMSTTNSLPLSHVMNIKTHQGRNLTKCMLSP